MDALYLKEKTFIYQNSLSYSAKTRLLGNLSILKVFKKRRKVYIYSNSQHICW